MSELTKEQCLENIAVTEEVLEKAKLDAVDADTRVKYATERLAYWKQLAAEIEAKEAK